MVARHLVAGESAPVGPWLRIRHRVTSFPSDGPLHSPAVLLLLWAAVAAGAALLVRSGYVFQGPAAQIALSAALAGAASNLFDRLRRGTVVDLLDLGWWPTFNLADVAITLGVVGAICLI